MVPVSVHVEKGVTSLHAQVTIEASRGDVWEAVRFPGRIQQFHPLVKESWSTSPTDTGTGSTRHCILHPMGEMEEKATDWVEGQGYTMQVIGGKLLPPAHFMEGHLELRTIDVRQTLISFTFRYKLRGGWLGRLMDMLMVRPGFRKAPAHYVAGLKQFIAG